MRIVQIVMVQCDKQLGQKDEIDCTVAGRGDEGLKLPFFGIVDRLVVVVVHTPLAVKGQIQYSAFKVCIQNVRK